jgi:carbamoyl-phosphate synthase small subunit
MHTFAQEAVLLLEDGSIFRGNAHGARATVCGELVFNTAHSGYEEVLTDPSYAGQIVVFTTSHLGNTGITGVDAESSRVYAEGFVCKEFTKTPDNPRATHSLASEMVSQRRPAMSDIDTRALTLLLREKGCLRAVLSTETLSLENLQERLQAFRLKALPSVLHPAARTYPGPDIPVSLTELSSLAERVSMEKFPKQRVPVVAVVDFGIKKGIAVQLAQQGLRPVFVPPHATVEEIKAIQPDGLFLSNGPGDPRDVLAATGLSCTLAALTPHLPTFGICMGHQVLALRYGARIRKLKFGHHAVNHPVREMAQRHMGYVTSQNHNFVTEVGDVPELEVSHVHLNDGTVAGLRHRFHDVFSVQFHPECNPGPHDAWGLFSEFSKRVRMRLET